ncbi:NUDIX pyrophosphatase [uncultured Eubacterium sp.]|uniref:NUDIX hydrolase n=1 Tax=uncultured Eubacterium sp. TaxID=165185 RepID=UPI0025892D82|nr:NUDIX domain-containing protein [uncultured Eubacterium sp.]
MSRAPYNILVLPYYIYKNNVEYCIFKRSDMNIWQFIAGGGEDDEEPRTAAIRESLEEASISPNSNYRQLVSMGYVSVENFSEKVRQTWGEKSVIPVFTFSVNLYKKDIVISDEHTEFKWCNYTEAKERLHFDLDKTALYELNEKIKRRTF